MADYIQSLSMHRELSFLDEGDDEVYIDYVETTTDPGDTLLVIAVVVCVLSIATLPLFVKLSRCLSRRRKRRKADAAVDDEGPSAGDPLSFSTYNLPPPTQPSQADASDLTFMQRCSRSSYPAAMFVLNNVVRWRKRGGGGGRSGETPDWRREAVSRGMAREARESMYLHRREGLELAAMHREQEALNRSEDNQMEADLGESTVHAHPEGSAVEIVLDPTRDRKGQAQTANEIPVEEVGSKQIEVQDPESESADPPGFLRKKMLFLWTIVKYDNETKRILRLAVPFTCSAIFETVGELVTLALISQYLGTNALVAYAMVDVVTGISSEFMGGWVEAISSLGSMAYGAGNYELVGQYVQTACVGFVLCEIPMAFVWGLIIDKVILLMGFEEEAALLAKDYVWIQVASNILEGVNEAILDFLEVAEREAYANIMYCVVATVEVGLVALFIIMLEANLIVTGLVMLTNEALFLFMNVLIANKMGWLRDFEVGLFGKCCFRNKAVMKETVKVALPLAFGSLLAYAEWEILTVFAAILGPAEAATWAVLGFVWDLFESSTEAIGDAGEVRCSYQLGKGRPALAKLSSYKSIFVATVMALVVTAIFLGLSNQLPYWLTSDPTIQRMLTELFPLVALGNITMNMGMVCWALIGAQGRYRLATTIAIGCSLFITIPLGAIFTAWLRIDLQGLTFSVVMGYTVTATLLSLFLLTSNWEKLSAIIREKVVAEQVPYESGDDSSSSSSSSSSDSDSEDDEDDGKQQSLQMTTQSIAAGSFEIPRTTPGFEPPPLLTPPTTPVRTVGTKHQKYRDDIPLEASRTPPRKSSHSPHSSPNTTEHTTPPQNASRKMRSGPMTPERMQAKSLTKLRSLGAQHVENSSVALGSVTPASIPPSMPLIPPGSPNSSEGDVESTTRVVKGRRKRIGAHTP